MIMSRCYENPDSSSPLCTFLCCANCCVLMLLFLVLGCWQQFPELNSRRPKPHEEMPPIAQEDEASDPPVASNGLLRRHHYFGSIRHEFQVNVSGGQNMVGDAANEASMCIDPNNPNRIAIAWRQFDSTNSNFRQAGYAFSTNGGIA